MSRKHELLAPGGAFSIKGDMHKTELYNTNEDTPFNAGYLDADGKLEVFKDCDRHVLRDIPPGPMAGMCAAEFSILFEWLMEHKPGMVGTSMDPLNRWLKRRAKGNLSQSTRDHIAGWGPVFTKQFGSLCTESLMAMAFAMFVTRERSIEDRYRDYLLWSRVRCLRPLGEARFRELWKIAGPAANALHAHDVLFAPLHGSQIDALKAPLVQ